ncbi:MAG: flippase-like domain-containing protein [Gammaproteobacteria bacterium]|nr:flippase-like domain-containing protein [Gammaproteobacteria bacterium]NIR83047.1 flippase-like domain-containing protein [Gammaproteobacteria bacterium]NIR90709.1 flippase-like domain-containing protein [Gammaproteobacteria bacterium]NIU04200.1 flippase-like domain-containing protein [Gammaproteobacteria bacterium]NIV51492.1 flippase-like domain-containing protein [Gammaproteobacteria bacterium]
MAAGVGLLAFILHQTDIRALWAQTLQVGWLGMGVVLCVYASSFVCDAAGWQLTLRSVPLNTRWLRRLFLVRMVGEAYNHATPLAGVGGEPIKAVLLKKHYGLDYGESSASLVLAKTTTLLALVAFLATGLLQLIGDSRVPRPDKSVATIGLIALGTGIVLFFLVQRFSFSSTTVHHLSRGRVGERLARRLHSALHTVRDVDQRLVDFYTQRQARFAAAVALGFANWFLGVLEVYVAMRFLGHPIAFTDAWIIEATAQLVRAGTFFIPASIGAQEGAFLLICTSLTGNPVLGVALALVRRVREVLWMLSGMSLGWAYSLRPAYSETANAR